jgi:hypothetical protein
MAAVMAFAYPAGGMKLGGAMGRSRWIDTVWAVRQPTEQAAGDPLTEKLRFNAC